MKTTPAKRAVFKPPVLHGFHAAANTPQLPLSLDHQLA